MSRDYPMLIGACGWTHEAWAGSYYPDDLPSDWRLGFYANEFPVVLVTRNEWERADADPQQWCEDSDSSLLFVSEVTADDPSDAEMQIRQIRLLGERCTGILWRTTLHNDAPALNVLLNGAGPALPVCVDFGEALPDEAVRSLLRKRQTGWCWHGNDDSTGLQIGPLSIARVASDDADLRQLRRLVETCLAAVHDDRWVILLFDGNPPEVERIQKAGVIMGLL
jgi:hypothetical protein